MNDDERLRQVLAEAVDGIEPTDRIEELRASVRPSSRVVPMTRSRYSHALAGIVATAAVIGVVAVVSHIAADKTAGLGPATSSGGGSHPATAIATDTALPNPTSGSAALYYLGDGPRGVVLYRELSPRPTGASALEYAVQGLMTDPADPDYRTPWHPGWLQAASVGGGQIRVALGSAPQARPATMTGREASEAVQQVVYTLQAAVHRREPVVFTRHGNPVSSVLGVPAALPISQGPQLDVLSRMSITAPSEGWVLPRGKLVVTGLNNSFESTVVVRLKQGGHVVRTKPGLATGYMAPHLFPWRVVVDTTTLKPGRYTLVASNDDPSGLNRADTDTRTIELR